MATKRYKVEDLEPFDAAEHLQDEEQIQIYLEEMAKENNAELWAAALDDVARARERWNLPQPRITLGSLRGKFIVPDDFDEPLSEGELRRHEGNLPPTG